MTAAEVERYTLSSLDELAETFGVSPPTGSAPRFNIAPLSRGLIRTAAAIAEARWGLLPPWRGHGGKRAPHVVHVRAGAIDQTPLTRDAFKARRCLVIADGWFIWYRTASKAQPMWIHPPPARGEAHGGPRSRPIGLAAIAATHRDDGALSFALIVGPAAGVLPGTAGPLEGEQPVVIAAADHAAWLAGPRDAAAALIARPAALPAGWRAEPVSTWVNSTEHDDARCVEPLGNPAQGELF